MSSLQMGRLLLGPPQTWAEATGNGLQSQGGVAVPAQANAPQFQVAIATWAADGNTDTLAARQTLRRQLRALLNNQPLIQQGFLYVIYSDDPEQDGWYQPDVGQLTDLTSPAGLATGLWGLTNPWYAAGKRRTHREAREVWMKDLRTNVYVRDALKLITSSDFSALPSLQLTVLPNGVSNPVVTVSGQALAPVALPTGRDGGVCGQVSGQSDMTVISYERPESALNLSDVIVYDRRGQITAPTTGPDTNWTEVPGFDWPWNWLTAGQSQDTPVLDNGLVRVRYDSTNNPGFRVDVWNGSAYVEQGKMGFVRYGDTINQLNTWNAAWLVEYTPDRTVMGCVLSSSNDSYSRERVYITVERGVLGVTFECYPALTSTGGQADVGLRWAPALNSGNADLNASVIKVDSQGTGSWSPGAPGTAVIAATAGTGSGTGNSGMFGAGTQTLGNSAFTTSENWWALLRYPLAYQTIAPYQTTLVVLQAANAGARYFGNNSLVYGSADNTLETRSLNSAGYMQVQVQFAACVGNQCLEAESMTLGSGTSVTVDGAASGGDAATTTRTSDANYHVAAALWPGGQAGQYRVFARVKISGGATGSIYAKTGAQTGSTVTFTNSAYAWVDLGDLTADGVSSLEIHLWVSTGSGTASCDRLEAPLTVDALRVGAFRSGSRDSGQAALQDSRTLGTLVARN